MGTNARHKDSVFSFLFGNETALLELYSAIIGRQLPPDTPIQINTLTNVLYMGQLNDLSFTVDERLVVLVEHQSTINHNMPLRLFLYAARVYESIIDRKKQYSKGPLKIPAPEFIVLYNGQEPYPDYAEMKLSDLYVDASNLLPADKTAPQALELRVRVYNINDGRNPEFLGKSTTLNGYSIFVGKLREYAKVMPFEDAMKSAIDYCIKNNILKSFFEKHSSEVFNMLLTEWNTEEAVAVSREEGREEGRAEGMEAGIEAGMEAGMEAGIEAGKAETAIEMLKDGFSAEQVARYVKMPVEWVERLSAQV